MQGYVTRKGQQWYAVIYEGLDPATGRERRRWHAVGRERRRAEALARQLARDENERRGRGGCPPRRCMRSTQSSETFSTTRCAGTC